MNKLMILILIFTLTGCASAAATPQPTPDAMGKITAWVAEGNLVQLAAQDGVAYTLSAYTKVYVSSCADGLANISYLYDGLWLVGQVDASKLTPAGICDQVAGR